MQTSAVARQSRRVFIVGGHTTSFLGKGHPDFIWKKHPDFGKKENPNLKQMINTAASGALANAGVDAGLIDRSYVGNFAGELYNQQGHLGAALAQVSPALMNKPSMRVEGACASGGLAIASAVDALKGGENFALVVGAEEQNSANAKDGAQYLARASDFHRQASIDELTFPCILARRTKHYFEKYPEFGLDDLNYLVAKAYSNGNKNPKAQMHKVKVDYESAKFGDKNPTFLANAEYTGWLRLKDCSQVTDGASALVLASEDGLKEAGIPLSKCVEVAGIEYGARDIYEDPADLAEMMTGKAVADRLYAKTGMSVSDVNVAEVHDCFAIAELMFYEAMGLCEAGKGAVAAKEGWTTLEGKLPVNTGGGLMSFGHPVGATGVKQVHEIYRQMKGECGDYQMSKRPEVGMTLNMGGDDVTVVASMLKNCA